MQKAQITRFPKLNFVESPKDLPAAFALSGFGETEGNEAGSWRWAYGPIATLAGEDSPHHGWRLKLTLQLKNPSHALVISLNGSQLQRLEPKGELHSCSIFFKPAPGPWQLDFLVSDWERLPPGLDLRPLAFVLREMRLEPAFETEGRICPYPFSRMEMPGAPFIPCCQSWLSKEYFTLSAGDDPWNGPAAQALRQSIYDGTYQYCQLDRCHTELVPKEGLEAFAMKPGELPITPANLRAIKIHDPKMPEGPAAATLMGDARCNLSCGSCRSEKITKLSASLTKSVEGMKSLLDQYGSSLTIIKAAGDGEVFFSQDLREIVQRSDRWEKLEKIDILTNGLLMNERTMKELEPGSRNIRSVNISIDAGDATTYQRVRGGDWSRLLENLRWASAERQKGRFDFLGLTFVLRSANLESLPAFLELAEELFVDEVYTSQLLPWERMPLNFRDEAVHLTTHPRYGEYLACLAAQKKRPWNFLWRSSLP